MFRHFGYSVLYQNIKLKTAYVNFNYAEFN